MKLDVRDYAMTEHADALEIYPGDGGIFDPPSPPRMCSGCFDPLMQVRAAFDSDFNGFTGWFKCNKCGRTPGPWPYASGDEAI